MRRYIIIVAIAVVVLGIGVVLYLVFKNDGGVVVAPEGSANFPVAVQETFPAEEQTSASSSPINMPIAVTARLVKISDGPIVAGGGVANRGGNGSSSPEVAGNFF